MNYTEIRNRYAQFETHIGMNPYQFVRVEEMSPIEIAMWNEIRCVGLRDFFPQYPILNYFADFANPKHKIVIECDGAAFHTDHEKDAIRQEAIEAEGWEFYRLTGSDCMRYTETIFRDCYGKGYEYGEYIAENIYELPQKELRRFVERNWYKNAELLCLYLKDKYYSPNR